MDKRTRRVPFVALILTAALVPIAIACSAKKPPPVTPTAPAPTDAGADGAWGAMGPVTSTSAAPDAGAPVATASADAGVVPAIPTAAPDTLQDAAIDLAIKALAAKDAPKMSPEGQPGRATLAEGGTFSVLVTLQPNRCYTIVGFSPPGGVTQLEAKLMAPPFTLEAGHSAATDKAAPVIGKGKGALCPFLPVPVPYRIDVTARKGSGRMGVQLFSRAK